jgi:hypothetical protein
MGSFMEAGTDCIVVGANAGTDCIVVGANAGTDCIVVGCSDAANAAAAAHLALGFTRISLHQLTIWCVVLNYGQ